MKRPVVLTIPSSSTGLSYQNRKTGQWSRFSPNVANTHSRPPPPPLSLSHNTHTHTHTLSPPPPSLSLSLSLSHTHTHAGRQASRQADKQTNRQASKQTNKQTGRQAGRQADIQTGRQAGRQTKGFADGVTVPSIWRETSGPLWRHRLQTERHTQ